MANNRIKWTDEDVDKIREEYPKGGITACIKALPHRRYNSVQAKVYELIMSGEIDRNSIVKRGRPVTKVFKPTSEVLPDGPIRIYRNAADVKMTNIGINSVFNINDAPFYIPIAQSLPKHEPRFRYRKHEDE